MKIKTMKKCGRIGAAVGDVAGGTKELEVHNGVANSRFLAIED